MSKKVIDREFLNTLSEFFIVTTKGEHFKIIKSEGGYTLSDITPPVLDFEITDYKSLIISKRCSSELLNGSTESSSWANSGDLVEKSHLGFLKVNESVFLLSKGKIDRCYYDLLFGGLSIRFHLFDFPGKKIPLDGLLTKSFSLLTDGTVCQFTFDSVLLFEGNEVLRICSLFGAKGSLTLQDLSSSVFETSENALYLNKPFLIIWYSSVAKKAHMSFISDPLVSVQYD